MYSKVTIVWLASLFCFSFSACEQRDKTSRSPANASAKKTKTIVNVISEQSGPDTLKGSLKSEANGRIGSANIRISYHSPAVRGRVVWGGLVPFNQVWVTGAHSATSFETDEQLTLGGQQLPAGKYALFTIPGKDEWVVIFNKNWQQHLADNYSMDDDVVRLKVKPEALTTNQERLRYQILTESPQKGNILFSWEKINWSVPITR